MRAFRASAAVLVGALVIVAAGCGGGSDDSESATSEWANSLCSAITTWTGSLEDSLQLVRDTNPITDPDGTRDTVSNAANDAKSATQDFVDDLQGLGAPDTQSGAEAKETIDQLGDDLSDGADDITQAVDDASTIPGALSAVTNTVTTMQNQITSAFSQLQQLDAAGDLEDAFEQADACADIG